MKRLRSSDDLNSSEEKTASKDWARKDDDAKLSRSSSHRNFYYKSENGRKGLSPSSSRYDRMDDDRDSSRVIRKRSDYDSESYDRRKNYDRYRDSCDRGILSSPRIGYGGDRFHRSESFSVSKRDIPKGFRSERDRSRREGSVSSWRRFGTEKDGDEGNRSASDTGRSSKVFSEDKRSSRSPHGPRDVKSPTVSKDSESEQSKSVELKKSEELLVPNQCSSEREEGELEPEPDSGVEMAVRNVHLVEDSGVSGLNAAQIEFNSNDLVSSKSMEDVSTSVSGKDMDKVVVHEEKPVVEHPEASINQVTEVEESRNGHSNLDQETIDPKCAAQGETDTVDSKKEENISGEGACDASVLKSIPSEDEPRERVGMELEARSENMTLAQSNKEIKEQAEVPVVALSLITEGPAVTKDKGKSIAVLHTTSELRKEMMIKVEGDSKSLSSSSDNHTEEIGLRGLDLFTRDPVRGKEKPNGSCSSMPKVEKQVSESLELSLSLPNILLPITSRNLTKAPGSPTHSISAQSLPSSYQTNPDGFTMSMSMSGTDVFSHDPSCSLTQNTRDNGEGSVKSRPMFQGIDQGWYTQTLCEPDKKGVPSYQRKSLTGDSFFHESRVLSSMANGQGGLQRQQFSSAEGSSALPIKTDMQSILPSMRLSGVRVGHKTDGMSLLQGVGSQENDIDFNRDKKHAARERSSSNLSRSRNQKEKEQNLIGGSDFAESMICMIVSHPVHAMVNRFNELSVQSIGCLKERVRNILSEADKLSQLRVLQKALHARSDITLEMLLKSNRSQLEVMVALKTGIPDFLKQNNDTSISNLAEIFLNLMCKNLVCKNPLPVDECDCKVCSQKSGFCSNCMCLICSKFDMAYNTCSWVGCDVCSHWCHTNCALRESYIRNGQSISGVQGTTEMQFHCVACEHPSEMFGFVKEVFQNFAKEWTTEVLCKELEYVKRIFSASEDVIGKRIHEISVQMLSRLANKSNLQEVQTYILGFLADSNSTKYAAIGSNSWSKNQEGANGFTSQEAIWSKSTHYPWTQPEKASSSLLGFESMQKSKDPLDASDMLQTYQKEPVFDELESIVRIKQAEARMFQTRADDARREAEGLKRIASAKNEKIEEEYATRIGKLRMAEAKAEEIQKQKLEEFEALDRACREYFNMKMRMEANIKELLLKMEATRRNLSK
ncbi:protein OBERON 4-like [Impatiens glandulifera]|uniref:protein OBERON 4-like n=1 Tax=Impatiens glandulifera TaxID=253017 RepID=UPI001FB15980|nr:protein OBERON 4-like [Impatiens glandulifera]